MDCGEEIRLEKWTIDQGNWFEMDGNKGRIARILM